MSHYFAYAMVTAAAALALAAPNARADAVTEWNQRAGEFVVAAALATQPASRVMAIAHTAAFQAAGAAAQHFASAQREAHELLGDRVRLQCASADAMPLADGCVDVTVSALMLNFAADAHAAVAEMAHVTVAGGTVGAYVWDYTGKMDLIRLYWRVAAELDPEVASQDQSPRVALCRPDALADLFERCGLTQIDVQGIDITMPFASFDDYWQPFLGGQGPAPAHAMSLAEPARARLRERLRSRLPQRADGSIELAARAWAVSGVVRT